MTTELIPSQYQKKFIPSEYQKDIYNFIQNGQGHGLIEAVAGSGKTTTIVNSLDLIPKNKSITYVAFNRDIVNELEKKVPRNINVTTFHSLGFMAIKDNFGHNVLYDKNKIYKLFNLILKEKNIKFNNEDFSVLLNSVKKILGLIKNNNLPATNENIDEIMEYYSINRPKMILNPSTKKLDNSVFYNLIKMIFIRSINDTKTIDFDDMIFIPSYRNLECRKYDYILIDETQDINAAQLKLILSSSSKDTRIVAVGDTFQCHPEDTIIQLSGNKTIKIKDIKVGMEVVSYSTGKSYFNGINTQGKKVEEISSRNYNGIIHNFSSGMKCTPNHRILVRWNKDTDYKHIVYLMRKGKSFRIGHANAIYKTEKNGRNAGLAMRCRHEDADEGWILSIHDNANESFIHEQIIQARFGIAGTPFKSSSGAHKDQWVADRIYSNLGDCTNRASKCLIHFNRDMKYPIWNKINVKNTGSGERTGLITRPHIIKACNYIPNFHEMKIFSGSKNGNWEKLNMNITHEKIKVYSLKVQNTEGGKRLYIANNTVVHNSIYGFRGADAESIPKLIETLNPTILPLSITYRCPKSHVQFVKKYVPNIEASPDAIEGTITDIDDYQLSEYVQENDLILCRNNAPLLLHCLKLIKQGINAKIKGVDIGKSLITLITSQNAKNIADLKSKIQIWESKEVSKAKVKDINPQTIIDKSECIKVLIGSSEAKKITDVIHYINNIFSDDTSPITFSTIHKAKGLEADNVFILHPHLMPSKWANKKWEKVQEMNILYVACTRAKKNMYMVHSIEEEE